MEDTRNADEIRILIVDDHAIVRDGLRALIESKPDFVLAGEAANGEEAVRQARTCHPDVILMDLMMPRMNGIDAIRAIKAENPDARILVLTSFGEDEQVFAAIKGGALGYLLKDSLTGELVEAIRSVYRGAPSLHPAVARKLLIGIQSPASSPASAGQKPVENTPPGPAQEQSHEHAVLTDREIEVLQLMAKGLSNGDISRQLVVGEGTVRFHVSNILSKLNLENRTQAVLYALRTGLAKLE
ncbi:MAG: response regulator transcription factor [Chloroflexi bacterium]|nr:response regulator transcription factor [Chloroflexota bacterium]